MTVLGEGYGYFLTALLLVVLPAMQILGRHRARALLRELDSHTRPAFYRQQILVLVGMAIVTLPPILFESASLQDYLLIPRNTLSSLAGVGVALAIWLAYRWAMAGLRCRETVRNWMQRNAAPEVLAMTPGDRRELPVWDLMSVAAGLGEELAYRGFLLWYVSALLSPGWAILLSAAGFAAAHAYQGWRSAVIVLVLGLFFAALTILSGSLWPAIVLHALVDMEAGRFYMRMKQSRAVSDIAPATTEQ